MFSGGEPTIHRHILDFIDFAQQRRIKNVNLNTNGIRLATDKNFVAELGKRNQVSGKSVNVYLQFDGFDERTHLEIRGRDLRTFKQRALDNCAEAASCGSADTASCGTTSVLISSVSARCRARWAASATTLSARSCPVTTSTEPVPGASAKAAPSYRSHSEACTMQRKPVADRLVHGPVDGMEAGLRAIDTHDQGQHHNCPPPSPRRDALPFSPPCRRRAVLDHHAVRHRRSRKEPWTWRWDSPPGHRSAACRARRRSVDCGFVIGTATTRKPRRTSLDRPSQSSSPGRSCRPRGARRDGRAPHRVARSASTAAWSAGARPRTHPAARLLQQCQQEHGPHQEDSPPDHQVGRPRSRQLCLRPQQAGGRAPQGAAAVA